MAVNMRDVRKIFVSQSDIDRIKAELRKNYINFEPQVDALAVALNNGENIYFVGEAGWGKTTIAKEFLRLLSIPYFDASAQNSIAKMFNIITPDMSPEEVATKSMIPNLDVYKTPSIMMPDGNLHLPKVTIIDELPDAKRTNFEVLKVLLEEGFLPNTNTMPGFVNNIFIAAGNRTREETLNMFKGDPMLSGLVRSLEAVWERFPREQTVQWDATRKDWSKLASLYLDDVHTIDLVGDITDIMARNEKVSPRIVSALINVFKGRENIVNDKTALMAQFSTLKIGNFNLYAEIIVNHIVNKKKLKDKKAEFDHLIKNINNAISELRASNLSKAEKATVLSGINTEMRLLRYSLGTTHNDEIITSITKLQESLTSMQMQLNKEAQQEAEKTYVNTIRIAIANVVK